jgi:murein L,D-transpeptidase YcbB/YkuD
MRSLRRDVLRRDVVWLLLMSGIAGFVFAQAAQAPLSASEALRERVERLRDDPAQLVHGESIAARRVLPELYASRDFSLAWTSADARAELLRAIRDSAADGLDPEDYHLAALEQLAEKTAAPGASAEVWQDYDLLQSDALARLLYHLLFGKVDPHEVTPHWKFDREIHRGEAAPFLQSVIDAPSVHAAIEREKPRYQMYRNLRAAYGRYRELRARGGWKPIPGGATLKADMRDARVPALRARLAATGELGVGASDELLFDDALLAALRAFQSANGLDADGAVGAGTLEALNRPLDARIEQLEVNLERGRWLLHDLDPTFVVVNVAGFRVYFLRDGELAWSARAQVGKPYRQTPIFRSTLQYLVLNPTWTVPPGIFSKDILPALKRDPGYLAKRGLEVVDANGEPVREPIDWASMTPGKFRYQLRQGPGPDNALGRVKFMFPNAYAVYLHDTPSQALFEKSARAFSSGCIRVEDALELAAALLEPQSGWDAAALQRAVDAGTTRTVTLEQKVPVLLTYWTAWVDREGALQLRDDVYGLDEKVRTALRAPLRVHRVPDAE